MNWSNQTLWTSDNLPVLRGMNSDSVDLIYLDPPFNSNHNYAAPIGSQAAGAAFKDTWGLDEIDIAWLDLIEAKHPLVRRVIGATFIKSDTAYLIYMAARLLELHRILKPTGSIYLHCDPTMSHYLKLLMDAVFGRKNFKNEVIWSYQGTGQPKTFFKRKHDAILFYGKSKKAFFSDEGSSEAISDFSKSKYTKKDAKGKYKEIKHPDGSVHRQYQRQHQRMRDVWEMPIINAQAKERLGYPTQKPLALLSRIIQASSKMGDMVLDPFCGCATACVAAEIHRRQWVGIDISPKAAELVKYRLTHEVGDVIYNGVNRTDVPIRTDLGKAPKYNSPQNRKALYGEQGGHCNGCNEHFQMRHLEIDHIIPRAKGGADVLQNLQLLCGNCNRVKGDRGMEYLLAKLGER